jgi:WD40 repeat protein
LERGEELCHSPLPASGRGPAGTDFRPESFGRPFTLRGHTAGVSSLALTADGNRLFSGSFDGTVKVWDLEVGKAVLTLPGHAGGYGLALSVDGKTLFAGDGGGAIRVWDLGAGK